MNELIPASVFFLANMEVCPAPDVCHGREFVDCDAEGVFTQRRPHCGRYKRSSQRRRVGLGRFCKAGQRNRGSQGIGTHTFGGLV